MHFSKRWVAGLAVCCGLCAPIAAQTKAKPATKAVAPKTYCHPVFDFCFRYPAAWTVLGEVFDGNGVVVAPVQAGARENWDEVTVAVVVRPPLANEDPATIEEAISQAVSGVRKSGQSFETLQRQQRTVDGQPAEMLKLQYTEQGSGIPWVEELVFIQGPESEIYSVALKCRPESLAAMEPLFARMVDSWKAPGSATRTPATGAPKPPSTTPKPSTPPKP